MTTRLVPMLLAAVISQGALAAEPIPLEHFFRLPWAVQVQISPDASHISALVRTEARPDAFNLVVMPREGGTPRPITGYDDIDVAAHFWKGNRIVFMLVQGLDEATEHLRYDSMYSIGADGSDPRQLHGDRRNRGIQLSLIDLLRRTSGQILVGGQRSLDPVPQPYRLDVQSGKLEAVPIDEGLSAMAADTEGRVKLAVRSIGLERGMLLFRENEQAAWRPVTEVGDEVRYVLHLDADGRHVWMTARPGRDKAALYRIDATDPQFDNPVAADERYDMTGQLVRATDGRPLYLRYEADRPRTVWLDPRWKQLGPELEAAMPDRVVELVSWDDAERFFVVWATSDREPGAFHLFDTEELSLRRLLSVQPWLDGAVLVPLEPIEVKARDGIALEGYLARPAGMTGPAPLVLFVHGGPFGVRDTWTFNPELQALASRGYAVLQVNFRGSGGYGREFEEAGYRQYGRAMQTDLEDAVAWAVDSGVADRDRVCIYGASYGGYAALMGLVRTPELYACGISLAGPTDLGLLYEEMTGFDPRSSKKPSLKGSRDPWMVEAADRLLGDPWQESEYFHLSSPARRVDRIRSPVMLAHGLSDTVVPIQHHKLMAYRLKRAGKPLVERIQGYEGHNVFAPQNGQRLYEDLLQFLDANIGPGASPDAETARAGD